jgi:hypothetical protein
MRKTANKFSRLTLRAETVRVLERGKLGNIVGGDTEASPLVAKADSQWPRCFAPTTIPPLG